MKKLPLLYLCLTISASLAANADDTEQTCKNYSQLAESTMRNRQNGTPITELMERLENASSNSPTTPIFKQLVVSAYKKNRFSSIKYQMEAITEFGNKAYLDCVENFKFLKKTNK